MGENVVKNLGRMRRVHELDQSGVQESRVARWARQVGEWFIDATATSDEDFVSANKLSVVDVRRLGYKVEATVAAGLLVVSGLGAAAIDTLPGADDLPEIQPYTECVDEYVAEGVGTIAAQQVCDAPR